MHKAFNHTEVYFPHNFLQTWLNLLKCLLLCLLSWVMLRFWQRNEPHTCICENLFFSECIWAYSFFSGRGGCQMEAGSQPPLLLWLHYPRSCVTPVDCCHHNNGPAQMSPGLCQGETVSIATGSLISDSSFCRLSGVLNASTNKTWCQGTANTHTHIIVNSPSLFIPVKPSDDPTSHSSPGSGDLWPHHTNALCCFPGNQRDRFTTLACRYDRAYMCVFMYVWRQGLETELHSGRLYLVCACVLLWGHRNGEAALQDG